MTWYANGLFYVILVPVVCVGYAMSLCMLFKYMETEINPELKPEAAKMAWQTVWFLVSLITFFVVRLLIISEVTTSYSTVMLVILLSNLLTDILPVFYVVYCHRRSFIRQREFYENYEQAQLKIHKEKMNPSQNPNESIATYISYAGPMSTGEPAGPNASLASKQQ